MTPRYPTNVLDHLGRGAGMVDELGLGAVTEHAMHQEQETRLVARGQAVNAMVLQGLGVVHQRRYRRPLCVQHQPTQQRMGPGSAAAHLNADV